MRMKPGKPLTSLQSQSNAGARNGSTTQQDEASEPTRADSPPVDPIGLSPEMDGSPDSPENYSSPRNNEPNSRSDSFVGSQANETAAGDPDESDDYTDRLHAAAIIGHKLRFEPRPGVKFWVKWAGHKLSTLESPELMLRPQNVHMLKIYMDGLRCSNHRGFKSILRKTPKLLELFKESLDLDRSVTAPPLLPASHGSSTSSSGERPAKKSKRKRPI